MTNTKKNYLSLERPDLLKEWDFEKNASICTPDEITIGSNKKVWWICSKGHSWLAEVNNRANGTKCPYCSGRSREKGTNDLAATNPELLAEWDYKRNNAICFPDSISARSHKKVYWKCQNGHSWQTEIRARTKGARCPFCSNQRVLAGYNDFATKYPKLLSEWDFKRNAINPSELASGSNKKVWWICSDCGNSWQASVVNRTSGSGCPTCARIKSSIRLQTASYQKSISFLYPELLKEWDYEKNRSLNPEILYPGSTKKAWWICPKCKQHYYSSINNRVKGAACPICTGKTIIKGINDLETWCKKNKKQYILEEWDCEKNGISPQEIAPFANKKIWFVCKHGHSYKSSLANRTSNQTGCPICNRMGTSFQEQACFYYLEKMFPDVINSYHDDRLGKLELDIYLPELKTAIEYDGTAWHKDKGKDELKNKLCLDNDIRLIRLRENGLPILYNCECISISSQSSRALNEAIETLLSMLGKEAENFEIDVDRDTSKILERYDYKTKENSIARLYPVLLKEWDYDKNGQLNPEYVNFGSSRKYWWKCAECGNRYLMSANNRTHQCQGCPICAKTKRVKSTSAYQLGQRGSIAENKPEILKEWDYEKNALTPDNYLVNSKKKVWWKCPTCSGSWQAAIQSRTKENGTGCPYCSGRKPLRGYNDLATEFPSLLEEWNIEKNPGLEPTDFTAGSKQKILWTCKTCGNEWEATIKARTSGEKCPKCARKEVAQKNARRVTCIETGKIFDYVKEAANWAGIKSSTLVGCLKGAQKSAGGYHWKYTD